MEGFEESVSPTFLLDTLAALPEAVVVAGFV